MSRSLDGLGVSPGLATGTVAWLGTPVGLPADDAPAGSPSEESARAAGALSAVGEGLARLAAAGDGDSAAILEAQSLMALDPALAGKVAELAQAGRSAGGAVVEAFDSYRKLLLAAGPYLAERVADLDDIRDRTIAALLGVAMPGVPAPGHPFVLCADDLSPADTATLDPSVVLAIVTVKGGPTSHTAILAKALGIPAVVACSGAAGLADGELVVVDGTHGRVIAGPTPDEMADATADAQLLAARRATSSGPGLTADGHRVKLLVNVGRLDDLDAAVRAGAEGVGLFRTEFLFLDRTTAPTPAEQESAYRSVFAAFTGQPVVVRTLDAGADKPLPFVDHGIEPNPALGVRGLRVARRHPELLTGQLDAIARASKDTEADVWVMAPMVSTPDEAAGFVHAARAAGVPVAGAMIEVPAAALRARQLFEVVDFASLGTNDLAQYALAVDRMAGDLADLLDPWQPALLALVAMATEAATAAEKPIGVCGEAASDPLLALVLVGLGVTSLSMAPVSIPDVRLAVAGVTLEQCRRCARAALDAPNAAAARARVAELVSQGGRPA